MEGVIFTAWPEGVAETYDREDDHVVQEVHYNRSKNPIIERQPEEDHSHEPRVDAAEPSEVRVNLTEVAVGAQDGGTNHPLGMLQELVLQCSESEEVGNRTKYVGVEPTDKPEGDRRQEGHDRHSDQKDQPPVLQLFKNAGVSRHPQALQEPLDWLEVSRLLSEDRRQCYE